MSNSEVVVVATIFPKADRMQQVREALAGPIGRVHAEDEGCLLYSLHEGDGRLVFVERWTSQEALEAHLGSDASAELRTVLEDALEGDLDVQFLKAVPAGEDRLGRIQ